MRIAVTQTPGAALSEWRATLDLLEGLIAEGAARRADLVVLPECAWPAYVLGSRAAYDAARAGGLPAPAECLARLCAVARRQQIAVCVGHVDEVAGRLFNAATLIGRDGRLLGTRHKCFLWDFDHDYFTPGARLEPVDTELGRIGLMICADARLPEIPATLAARGAELLLQPTAWVNAGTAQAPWNPQPEFLIPARAAEFGVPVASASKWGPEGAADFVGGSLICDTSGQVVAQCRSSGRGLAIADVVPGPPRRAAICSAERAVLTACSEPVAPAADVPALRIDVAEGNAGLSNLPALRLRTVGPVPDGSSAPPELVLTAPAAAPSTLSGVRIAALPAAALAGFAACRCFALAGGHVVVAFGEIAPALARTRACENRVFVLTVSAAGVQLIDPRGQLCGMAAAEGQQQLQFECRSAADKTVARGTDNCRGRRPELYEF